MNQINQWLYKLALKFVQKTINNSENKLTPAFLVSCGWERVMFRDYTNAFCDPNVKERDRLIITFSDGCYRVWHGKDKQFIACESSREWLQLQTLCIDRHIEFGKPDDIIKAI